MKKFDNLQELWSYCMFCPLCQDMTRSNTIVPTTATDLLSIEKEGKILTIRCEVNIGLQRYEMSWFIDCVRNTFLISIPRAVVQKQVIPQNPSNLCFYIISDCNQCLSTSINCEEVTLDLLSKKVSNFNVTMEGYYLLEEKNKYHLTINHKSNITLISKCFVDDNGEIVDDNKILELPLIAFDFTDLKKVVNRIQTLLVFS